MMRLKGIRDDLRSLIVFVGVISAPQLLVLQNYLKYLTDEASAHPDSYFSDAYYGLGDYFLSDGEILEPLSRTLAGDSTSDSSPEPFNTNLEEVLTPRPTQPASRLRLSPPTSTARTVSQQNPTLVQTGRTVNKTPTFSRAELSSLFLDPDDPTFATDLTYQHLPTVDALETASAPNSNSTSTKRNRGPTDPISACWTSPLCPNHAEEGTPPNPSTCNGACAPFLFADSPPSGTVNGSLLNQEVLAAEDSGVVQIRPRLKRTESDSSRASGRDLDLKKVEDSPQVKHESSPSAADQDSPMPTVEKTATGKVRRRVPHNQVERKYRETLNTQLESLRRVVPSLQEKDGSPGSNPDIEDLPTPTNGKPSKAVILATATAYIKQVEKEKKKAEEENMLLRKRIKALQMLVKCDDCSLMQYVMDLKIHEGRR
ncbi:hypothetical protein M501DRAFT_1011100 [Patellaria atrata CBS 101060]|uniref:BHLH domain-containing protein n=1 Tax=Patellaria atrata CBS 101060 TaxID=1346257 RepID=A0A9P4SAT4_9PEZI|nr:hypothetical protein M501DRAFT_1011100 [Patellaria atrata CBS 101060]